MTDSLENAGRDELSVESPPGTTEPPGWACDPPLPAGEGLPEPDGSLDEGSAHVPEGGEPVAEAAEPLPATPPSGTDRLDGSEPSADAAEPAAEPGDQPRLADEETRLARCERRIGYTFSDRAVLREALTHSSGAEHRLASNERLEFLGDAILGAVVCELLFARYPRYLEGDLTKIKSAVVSRQTCARSARRWDCRSS